MKSELSFLMDLFLNDEVPQPIKKIVGDRMREVEKEFSGKKAVATPPAGQWTTTTATHNPIQPQYVIASLPDGLPQQAPSMQRIIQANPDIIKPPVPVTPAAAAALQHRAKIMQGSLNEKPEEGRTSPRKF